MHEEPTNRLSCAKKRTYHRFGIYGINDRHKLVGCISLLRTLAVLLLLFWRLSCKANYSAFLYGEVVPVKKWKALFVVEKYYRLNVSRIALRIKLVLLVNWFLVTFSFIHICLAPRTPIILCRPEPSREAL